MAAIDAHVSRELSLVLDGRTLTLAASLALFSSHQVDVGSRMLLRTLRDHPFEGARVLDLGCGTGALGLALAARGAGHVDLVDRDALALAFAAENARRNGLPEGDGERVTVRASLGVDDVRGVYDLVVSNVPGKAGAPVIASLLEGACAVLRPGGTLAVVVIAPIREAVAATFERLAAASGLEVQFRHDTADYGVFHVRPRAAMGVAPAFEAGVYDAGTLAVEDAQGEVFTVATVHGLPHYDRPDPIEALLARRLPLEAAPSTVLIANVGQGALAVTAHRAYPDARLILVDRDLLALRNAFRNARRNLLAHGAAGGRVELRHQPWWDVEGVEAGTPRPSPSPSTGEGRGMADLVLATLGEREGPVATAQEYLGLVGALRAGGSAIVAASSTAATRLLEGAPLPRGVRASRYRHRGTSILTVTRE